MKKRVKLEELRLVVADALYVTWRRAPEHPTPFGSPTAWERVDGADDARGDDGVVYVIRAFYRSVTGAEQSSTHYRLVIPLEHYYSLRLDALARRSRELRALLDGELALGPGFSIVFEASAPPSGSKRPVELGFPLVMDSIVPPWLLIPETWRRSPVIDLARRNGLIAFRTIDATEQIEGATESSILHFYVSTDSVAQFRRILARRSRPPRFVIIAVHSNNVIGAKDIGLLFAEPAIAAGCSAVAIVVSEWTSPDNDAVEALLLGFLSDLTLDRAIAEVNRGEDEHRRGFLVATEGGLATRPLFDAILEHKNEQGSRLLDVFAEAIPEAPPKGELARFLRERLKRAQRDVDTIVREVDTSVLDDLSASIPAFAELHGRAQEALNRWQRVRSFLSAERRPAGGDVLPEAHSLDPAGQVWRLRELPPRHTKVWVTGVNESDPIQSDEPLESATSYRLKVQIGFEAGGAPAVGEFPIQDLIKAFEDEEAVDLDVIAFARDDEMRLREKSQRIKLPRFGESGVALFRFMIVQRTVDSPRQRVRIGVYYKNRLLQSVAVDLAIDVGQETTYELDYIASHELLVVDELPKVRVSFFLNDGPNGTHSIGIAGLSQPAVLDLDPALVRERLKRLRDRYGAGQGRERHMYADPLHCDTRNWAARERQLVELATLGRRIFFEFIIAQETLDRQLKQELGRALREPDGLIQIARCRATAPGLPWGTVYDYNLKKGRAHLCEVFADQLRRTAEDRNNQRYDLLDDPKACAAQQHCPLARDPGAEAVTICPFGFWGIRHRIEQPTESVKPQNADGASPQRGASSSISPLPEARGDGSIAAAYWQFENSAAHLDELRALSTARGGALDCANKEAELKAIYRKMEEATIVYFYCHAEDDDGVFTLKLGDRSAKFKLSADALSQEKLMLRQSPLVVLNGCETLAVSPESIHGFLVVLRDQQAGGVVGPEVTVWTSVAKRVGESLVKRFLNGEELGRALQGVQRELMREMNPIGLMYVAYSRADLKFVSSSPRAPGSPAATQSDIVLE